MKWLFYTLTIITMIIHYYIISSAINPNDWRYLASAVTSGIALGFAFYLGVYSEKEARVINQTNK